MDEEIEVMEKYVHRFLLELADMELSIEDYRDQLSDGKNFSDMQIFATMMGDELEKEEVHQNYLTEASFERFFRQNSKMLILKRDLQYFTIHFSEKNNRHIMIENLQDLLIPHQNLVCRKILQNQRLKQLNSQNNLLKNHKPELPHYILDAVTHIFECEVKLFRRLEKSRREVFQLFKWGLLKVPLIKAKKISYADLEDFFSKYDPECKIVEKNMKSAWRRLFHNNHRKYGDKEFRFLKEFLLPSDYLTQCQVVKQPYFGFEHKDEYIQHERYIDYQRQADYHGQVLQPQLNEEWQQKDDQPTFCKFQNLYTIAAHTANGDRFAIQFERQLKLEKDKQRRQELDKILHGEQDKIPEKRLRQAPKRAESAKDKYLKRLQTHYYYTAIRKIQK